MSGICGIIRLDGSSVEKDEIQKLLDAMQNNGSDTEGFWLKGTVALGHKMLWVTPESLHENQPLVSEDSQFILTADARIDNREELIQKFELTAKTDKVITDIDLILHAYKKWGEKCPKYLLGDYAFAIWDIEKKQLLCVRDPMGIRQFYYYHSDTYFVFSSEIQSIVDVIDTQATPNISAMKNFLNESSIPYESTFYEEIHRLPPAHILILSKDHRTLHRYWFPERIPIDKNLTFKEAIVKFNELFALAINARMRSAYPIGSHLSGGLDSSAVTAKACTMHGKNSMTVFSLHYGTWECDESQYSTNLIEQYGLKAEIIRGDLLDYSRTYTVDRYSDEDPDWPGAGLFVQDLPVMERAKDLEIRVMLTGQGGDHILTGSNYMLADYLKSGKIKRLYKELKYYKFSKNIIKHYIVLPLLPKKIKNALRILLCKKRTKNKDDHSVTHQSYFQDMEKRVCSSLLFSQEDELRGIAGAGNAFWMSSGWSISGRYHMEHRHPFYDKRLIEFTLSLPPYMKLEQGVFKKLLREAMGESLPDIIRERYDKAEFSKALKHQLTLLDLDTLEVEKIFTLNIKERKDFEKEMKMFKNGSQKFPVYIWNAILMEKWLKKKFK